MTGKLNDKMLAGIINPPNNAGIPITAKTLKIHEPSTFPTAISALPCLTAATVTASSSKDVPSATALTAISSVPMFKMDDNAMTESMVYFAPR